MHFTIFPFNQVNIFFLSLNHILSLKYYILLTSYSFWKASKYFRKKINVQCFFSCTTVWIFSFRLSQIKLHYTNVVKAKKCINIFMDSMVIIRGKYYLEAHDYILRKKPHCSKVYYPSEQYTFLKVNSCNHREYHT